MTEKQNTKQYDLEERTYKFARRVNAYTKSLPVNSVNIEIGKQLIRSGGSVGANYIEANESFSRKDFIMRVKICRKEAKESSYWLKLSEANREYLNEKDLLIKEADELMKIFGSIIEKCK